MVKFIVIYVALKFHTLKLNIILSIIDLLESVLIEGYQNYTDAVVTGLKLIVGQTTVR
jgi:hypothetical protein